MRWSITTRKNKKNGVSVELGTPISIKEGPYVAEPRFYHQQIMASYCYMIKVHWVCIVLMIPLIALVFWQYGTYYAVYAYVSAAIVSAAHSYINNRHTARREYLERLQGLCRELTKNRYDGYNLE